MITLEEESRIAGEVMRPGRVRQSAPLTVAVLGAGVHVVLVHRQNGAGFVGPQIAFGKA